MTKRKIIVNPNFIKSRYNSIVIDDKVLKDDDPLKIFTDPNNEYILNFNEPSKKTYSNLYVSDSVFDKLNVCGDFIVNFNDVHRLSVNLNHCTSKSLTINQNNGNLNFSASSASYLRDQCPLKRIALTAESITFHIDNLKNVEEVVINNKEVNSHYYNDRSSVSISNCPKLKKLDVSKILEFGDYTLRLKDIPDDCIIVFNSKAKFTYDIGSPTNQHGLKRMFPILDVDYNRNQQEISIVDLLNVDPKSETVAVSYKTLKQKANELGNKDLLDLYKTTVFAEKDRLALTTKIEDILKIK